MMRTAFSAALCLTALVMLPACSFTEIRETVHRSVPAAGSPTVHVSNSVGGVSIRAWDKPTVDVVAEKSAHSAADLNNIQINVDSRDGAVSVTTVNNAGGGFWHGGGVGYTIMVPTGASLDINNVTGGVRISGVSGNVVARVATGGIEADIGRVSGNRNVDMRVITGGIDVTIARDSNATLDMHTTVGGVRSAFSGNRIGTGSARVHLETTTGGVRLRAS